MKTCVEFVCFCCCFTSGDDWHRSEHQRDEETFGSHGRDRTSVELSPWPAYHETPRQPEHPLTKLMLQKDSPKLLKLDVAGSYRHFSEITS